MNALGERTFPQVLQLSKDSHSHMTLDEITCELYSMCSGTLYTLRSQVGFRGRSFLLAQIEMLVMLYLHGAGLQGFPYVIDRHCSLSGISWIHVLEQVQKWIASAISSL